MMDSLHPGSAMGMSAHRREAIRLAAAQEKAVVERCKRSNQEPPPYTFGELIGKGSFGRVYKGHSNITGKVVAIKVLDIDDADFRVPGDQKDEQIRDFNREIRILRQAQNSGAQNLNQIIEALPVHSQLWLICEHCPGGSVKTLMRATNDRLPEKFIVVIARELGKALKGLHDAGIIHRDVKAANVLIHEEGRLQLCDFGVATVLDARTDKRRTFIGTLHWMPPELWTDKPEYSDEVDVWEYGCTIYECALGRPPNSDLRERQQLRSRMRRLDKAISLPESENFTSGLRSLINYTLSPNPNSRPNMKDVLEHEYLANTEESHPTQTLSELVSNYYAWLLAGGMRVSLFMPGGAAAAATEDPDAHIAASDEWNFSATQDFERRVSAILEIPQFDIEEEELTPRAPQIVETLVKPEMTAAQQANFEARVKRGAGLNNIFNQSAPDYTYEQKSDFVAVPEPIARRLSDLPFRAMNDGRPSSIVSNIIDLGDFDEDDYVAAAPRTDGILAANYVARDDTFKLMDAASLRQRRADSKGPKDVASLSLTARRASSADDAGRRTTDNYDFASSPNQATIRGENHVPTLQSAAEIVSSKPGHATMDWSFASAMSALPQEPQSEPETDSKVRSDQSGPGPEESERLPERARKHATLEWSFSNAMAEASANIDEEPASTESATRTTPARPTPIRRQITMPVTADDFQEVEDYPRPSTAMSQISESSFSSLDIDPFALERSEDEYPSPAALDETGISNFYASRGQVLGAAFGQLPPSNLNSNTLTNQPVYPAGRPPRIGDDNFPGPQSYLTNQMTPQSGQSRFHGSKESNDSASTNSSAPRPFIEVPDPLPPSAAAMSGSATAAEVEAELARMLQDMQASLQAAGQVVKTQKRRGRTRARDYHHHQHEQPTDSQESGGTKPSSSSGAGATPNVLTESEWEDEE